MRFREAPPAAHVATIAMRQDECYNDYGEPDACATEQETQDGLALGASLSSEIDSAQADLDAEEMACSEHPCGDEESPASGPSVGEAEMYRCVEEMYDATFAGAGAVLSVGLLVHTASLGAGAVATGVLAATVGAALIGVAGFVFAGVLAYKCFHRREMEMEQAMSETIFETALATRRRLPCLA